MESTCHTLEPRLPQAQIIHLFYDFSVSGANVPTRYAALREPGFPDLLKKVYSSSGTRARQTTMSATTQLSERK